MQQQVIRRWQLLDSLNLDEKIVVITGGGTGLGLEMGRDLARAGLILYSQVDAPNR